LFTKKIAFRISAKFDYSINLLNQSVYKLQAWSSGFLNSTFREPVILFRFIPKIPVPYFIYSFFGKLFVNLTGYLCQSSIEKRKI
jgi:hypothetical protein